MWIEIFKTGSHTDSSGNSENYTDEILDKITSLYNGRISEDESLAAPLVKGHPQTNEPAYGWIERLARRGSLLLAKLKDLSPQLIDEVRKGMYRKVSMAIYPDLMLRHVGLLGAVSPAVKGLRMVNFNEVEEFREYQNENADTSDSEPEDKPQEEENPELIELNDCIAQLERQNREFEEENIMLKEKILIIEKENRLKEFREFANSLIENPDGSIILPSQTEDLIDLLEAAFASDEIKSESKEFSFETSHVEKLKSFIGGMRPPFSIKEFACKGKNSLQTQDLSFVSKNVSPERLRLHELAKSIQEESPGLSYEEAVCKAQKEYIS